MPSVMTETKFADLKSKLRELFELDKSDLDFGIYRIMAAKNKEVTEFLDRQLRDVVRETLAAHGAGAAEQVQAELNEALQRAQQLGADPDSLPKVRQLKAKLASAAGTSAAELEADIYNHLLAFFSRYYDEGDFISKRRYKGDTYAIPYNGEEVTLYWANKDQYYIKSGEWHKDYRFKAGEKSVHFKLVEATQETNNNKEPDDAKRRYILAADAPVVDGGSELTLRFEFRVPTEAERQAVAEATRIFGGNYGKSSGRTKGDEREQFCADAEQRALAAMPEPWRGVVTAPAATESKPLRTLLGKHLDYFTARNTFDYFIHKDLGGFLKRELDFYIKNEVVRLDDLETLPPDHLQRVQGRVKAIRTVAGRVIDFLAAVENFQKKLWLKKKFVLDSHYCFTVDRAPEELYAEIAANDAQREEWVRLFAIDEIKAEKLGEVAYSKPLTVEFLKSQPHLVLDTKHFPDSFKQKLLATVDNLDEKLDGVLIHSENFQALRLMEERYREQVDCVYIDPPYNTGDDGFVYRDMYQHSSWLALMAGRLPLAAALTKREAGLFTSIDEGEQPILRLLLDAALGRENFIADMVWAAGRKNDSRYVSVSHEYIVAYARDAERLRENNATWRQRKAGLDDIYAAYARLRKARGKDDAAVERGLKQWFAGLPDTDPAKAHSHYRCVDERGIYFPADISWPGGGGPKYEVLHPKTGKPVKVPSRGWMTSDPEKMQQWIREGLVHFGEAEDAVPCIKSYLAEREYEVPYSVVYQDGRAATKRLRDVLGTDAFGNPKDEGVLGRVIAFSSGECARVADFFAGSGTTAHAVINLNREDGGNRKYILVEMGEYFHTVLLPRIKKVVYSRDWKDGKPTARDTGISHAFKHFAMESYEDALNDLPAPGGDLLANADAATKEALVTYSLDLELGPRLLNLDVFRDPWAYSINAQPAGEAEIRPHRVDLVETFNYLLGLKVHAYGPMERYNAEFQRAEHTEGLGRLKVAGRLRRDPNGPFIFQRVEGELLDGARVLVVWRKLSGEAEKDSAVLEAWMERHREDTKQRSEHRDYHQIYINGPVTLPQPTAEIRTVLPIEQTFKDRMFAGDGAE